MNKEQLTSGFAVECTAPNSLLWKGYINVLNRLTRSNFSGNSVYSHYGMRPIGTAFSTSCVEDYEDVKVISLEDALKCLDIEIVELHDGRKCIAEDAVTLSSYTENEGELAYMGDCFQYWHNSEYHWIPRSEMSQDRDGTWFPTDYAESCGKVWSEYHDEWLNQSSDYVYYGYVYGRCEQDWFQSYDAIEVFDEWYYDHDAARYHGYVMYNDEWYCSEDIEEKDNACYHDSSMERLWECPTDTEWTVGFEIEKEDMRTCSISYRGLYSRTNWIKEDDGSLNQDIGYELVSPVYNLFDNKLDKDIKSHEELKTLINANYSDKCGGHINIGSRRFSPKQIFEHLSGWFPLMYSLYTNRLSRSYSEAKKIHRYREASGIEAKYSAFHIKDFVLEFRLPPAVQNVDNLIWRRDLIRIMVGSIKLVKSKNFEPYWRGPSEVEVLKMLMTPSSKIYKHLRKIFTQEHILDKKVNDFIKYSESFNDKIMPRIIRGNNKPDNLGDTTNELGA